MGIVSSPGLELCTDRELSVDSLNIIRDDAKHARVRRILSHSFSDRALKEQAPLFKRWSGVLVEKLTESVNNKPNDAIDLLKMYNCTTFDIMGDLTFAEPLHMLEDGEYVFPALELSGICNSPIQVFSLGQDDF